MASHQSPSDRQGMPSPVDEYLEFLDVIPDIVVSMTSDGRLLACSHAVMPLLGFAPEELVGRRLDELPTMDAEGLATAGLHLPRVAAGEHVAPVLLPLRDRKSTRLNSSHSQQSRMPSSA